ncbi:MAG: DNA polymerase III subunit delta, partial [Clostridia bacterium]|nr:DNA polymerase III subunit delta [Clostridia bacterium]
AANTLPFFGSRRLVIVKDIFNALKNNDESELLEYLNQPLASTCLVLIAGEQVDKRRKLFKSCQKVGKVLEFAPLKPEALRQWVKSQGSIAPAALELLLRRLGNNLLALEQELNKLQTLQSPITLAMVQKLTPIPLEENIFKVVESICNRQTRLSFQGLQDLLQLKQPPQLILASLAARFREIYRIKTALAEQKSDQQIMAELSLPAYALKKIKKQAISPAEAQRALLYLQKIDRQTKQGQRDFAASLEEFILTFSLS